MLRRTSVISSAMLALALLLTALTAQTASAQDQRCFSETGFCISGPIRGYWDKNGGLPIFGYPISSQRQETVEGRTIQVQWFERDRLEIQTDGSVTAGRLGVELLEKRGTPWQQGGTLSPDSGCIANFPTGHQICGAFASFWQNNGGVVRLGYPVSGQIQETIEGQSYTVQYFERRRFELHGSQVLLGLLGREVLNMQSAPPQPSDPCADVPASVSAEVAPRCGPAGTVFAAIGGGFSPNENIGVYVTAPDQSVLGAPFQVQADRDGVSEIVTFSTLPGFPKGIYAISFEGVKSKHKAIAYFRVN